jgi:hypothetical protein
MRRIMRRLQMESVMLDRETRRWLRGKLSTGCSTLVGRVPPPDSRCEAEAGVLPTGESYSERPDDLDVLLTLRWPVKLTSFDATTTPRDRPLRLRTPLDS